MKKHLLFLFLLLSASVHAQVGEHRNDLAVGVNGGYVLSNVSFVPSVPQGLHGGITGGFSVRYTCEKYFKSICALYAEVNYAKIGWKEEILDINDKPVINPHTQLEEEFKNTINYIQIPVMAHLGWGRERSGFQFFVNIGPQFGVYLSEASTATPKMSIRRESATSEPDSAKATVPAVSKISHVIDMCPPQEFSRRDAK